MFILLDENSPTETVRLVQKAIHEEMGPEAYPVPPETYSLQAGEYVFATQIDTITTDPIHQRWAELFYASKGARMYHDMVGGISPIYAGMVPKSSEDIKRLIADAKYSANRARYFESFGVNYIGRTHSDPRNIFVLDNKGKNKSHSSLVAPDLGHLYNSLPFEWWPSCGFVSTGNVTKLGDFLEAVPGAIPLAYSQGALAKLDHLGVDYATAALPPVEDSPQYGVVIRELANRLSYDLSLK